MVFITRNLYEEKMVILCLYIVNANEPYREHGYVYR